MVWYTPGSHEHVAELRKEKAAIGSLFKQGRAEKVAREKEYIPRKPVLPGRMPRNRFWCGQGHKQ
jgi:hypothetical protein